MKLLMKFNLILGLVLGGGLGLAGWVSYRFLQEDAREDILRQARLMMEAMQSARSYTSRQVGPILEKDQEHLRSFLPETVPAYAATESFNYLRARYPDYSYKEATLNPTNPRDRALDWEADIINSFRNHSGQKELIGERDSATGRALFLARPITADAPCLDCHDRARTAPAALIRHYGSDNGFGWHRGEVVGAQIVAVPMTVPVRLAAEGFQKLMAYFAGVFAVSLILLDVVLLFVVVRPLRRLSVMADQISVGKLDIPELPVRGRDEIAVLAESFNRMRRSLERALKMLEGN